MRIAHPLLLLAICTAMAACKKKDDDTPPPGGGGNPPPANTVTDIDGNVYPWVDIGSQRWMAANLRTTKFANGDPIPNITATNAWMTTDLGAWCHYDNDPGNDGTYGKLYNGFALMDGRNVCPSGWHVPTQDDWNTLIAFLGGQSVAGGKLKETGTVNWAAPNTGATNESGFTARPGGFRVRATGAFIEKGVSAYFGSSTYIPAGDAIHTVWITATGADAPPFSFNAGSGFSCRCIKD